MRSTLLTPIIFAILATLVWIVGIVLDDRPGGTAIAQQLLTISAATWQRRLEESTVKAENIEKLNVSTQPDSDSTTTKN